MVMKRDAAQVRKGEGYSGRRQRVTFGYILLLAVLTLLCLTMLYPFINLLFQSFSKASDIVAANGLML